MPLLSIIVPIYNSEKYLKKCIDSILNQTFKDYEIILIDDGCDDACPGICDEYASKYEFITVIHSTNCGITAARNTGIKRACGKFIAFVDSDDWIDSDMYSSMMEKLTKTNADMVICDIVYESETKKVLIKNHADEGFYDKKALERCIYNEMMFDFNMNAPKINPSLCNKIMRLDIMKKVASDIDEKIVFGEDAICTYALLLESNSIYIVHGKDKYHYRNHTDSVTNTYDKNLFDKIILLAKELSIQFSKRQFSPGNQFGCYIAKYSLECIRNELLFNKKLTLRKKLNTVKAFLRNEIIADAFRDFKAEANGRKERFKIFLACRGMSLALYFMFRLKAAIGSLQGE